MAYFSPPYTLLRRIARVAKTGRARLLMAAKSDNGATLGATRSLYRYLLKRKARIWDEWLRLTPTTIQERRA